MLSRKMLMVHPGEILKSELIQSNGLSVTKVAEMLKVSRQAISNILNERADVSPEMALRISVVFGGTPDIWLRIQAKYDLQKAKEKIKELHLVPYAYPQTA